MDAGARLGWIKLYEEVGDAGLVCRRCGISRPTLRKWWRRYRAEGEAGLRDRSKRPRTSPGRKVPAEQEGLILRLRRERKPGIEMLRNELARRHGLRLALDTIYEVLVRRGENRLERPRPKRKGTKRYSRPVPGDRVQMDTCKIAPGLYQYTAIDDCSRWQVLGVFPRRTARQHPGVPRPRGRRDALPGAAGADRPRPGVLRLRGPGPAPGPPGQVPPEPAPRAAPERQGRAGPAHRARGVLVHRRPAGPGLAARLEDWRTFYDHHRPHGALGGGTPAERIAELAPKIPTAEAVRAAYDPSREFIRSQDTRYRWLPTSARVT